MSRNNKFIFMGLILIILLLAFLLPAIVLSTDGPQETVIRQETDSYVTVANQLQSTIDGVNDTSINITMINEKTGASDAIKNLSIDETKDLTLNSENISVTNSAIVSSNTFLLTYEYPNYYNWPDGAQLLVENIVMILLAILILLIAVAIMVGMG